jgi:hypothetical protein
VGVRKHVFHIFMYALADEFAYPALKAFAYDTLVSLLIHGTLSTSTLKTIVEATFAPPGEATITCKDMNRTVQNLVVASVIARKIKNWNEQHWQEFETAMQGPAYAPFWTAYNAAGEENKELIEQGKAARALADKRVMATDERKAARRLLGGAGGVSNSVHMTGSPMPNGGINKRRKARSKKNLETGDKANSASTEDGGDVDMEL